MVNYIDFFLFLINVQESNDNKLSFSFKAHKGAGSQKDAHCSMVKLFMLSGWVLILTFYLK